MQPAVPLLLVLGVRLALADLNVQVQGPAVTSMYDPTDNVLGQQQMSKKRGQKNRMLFGLSITRVKTTPDLETPPRPWRSPDYDYQSDTSWRRRRTTVGYTFWGQRPATQPTWTRPAWTPEGVRSTPAAASPETPLTSPGTKPEPHKECSAAQLNMAGALCCKMTPGQLLDWSDLDKCYTGTPALSAQEIDTTFIMHLALDTSKELNVYLDFFKNIYETMCVVHCFFSDKEFLSGSDPKSLRYPEINSYFESSLTNSNGSDWIPVVQEAVDECEDALEGSLGPAMPDFIETEDSTCFTRPFLYVQCVRRHMVHNCPEPMEHPTGAEAEQCVTIMDQLNLCNPFDK